MWNNDNNGQGNGNGQGYTPQGGYGQPQDAYARLDNAREVGGARFPYISAGTHKLALVSLEEFNGQQPKVRALFKVIDSHSMQAGSFCVKIWSLVKPPRFPNGATEGDEFADFMMKLKGAPKGFQISASIRTLLKERPMEQLARGTVIECTGVAGKVNPQFPTKEPYVRVYWNSLVRDPATIIAMRQRLEQEGIPSTSDNAQPQGGQQMMQPQQNYAPPEGAFGRPAQTYVQPQGFVPQQMQNPHAGVNPQQQYAPQQPPAQPAPGVPQGGFLANVPTNNGGNGNGGTGW